MANGYVQMPDDAANTGKKIRTQTRTVGSDSVHEHYNILQDVSGDTQARILGIPPSAGDPGLVTRNIPSGVQNASEQNVIGVQVVGGISPRVSISGDQLNVTATDLDIRNINPSQDSIHVSSGVLGITGDVSTAPKAGQTWPVAFGGTLGVQVIGGSIGARVSISGDQLAVTQQGAWASAVTGDVLLRQNVGVNIGGVSQQGAWSVTGTGDFSTTPKAGSIWPISFTNPIGVQVVGGGTNRVSISGDTLAVTVAQTLNVAEQGKSGVHVASGVVSISGDRSITDGADPTIESTVRDYANANPLTVVLTNASGDTYSPTPKEPDVATVTGRITAAGSTQIAGPYNGRVIKVFRYEIIAESDTTQCHFSSAASGDRLTAQWLFNAREGVVEAVSPLGGGYLFKTGLNKALTVENAGSNFRYAVSFHSGDSN